MRSPNIPAKVDFPEPPKPDIAIIAGFERAAIFSSISFGISISNSISSSASKSSQMQGASEE